MLLQIEMVLVCIVTEVTLIWPEVFVTVHVTLIRRKVREALVTEVALVQLLVVLHVCALDVLLHLVIRLEELVTEGTGESWRLMQQHVILQFVVCLEFFPADITNTGWNGALRVDKYDVFLQRVSLSKASATFCTKVLLLLLVFLLPLLIIVARLDLGVAFPSLDHLLVDIEHVVAVGQVCQEDLVAILELAGQLVLVLVLMSLQGLLGGELLSALNTHKAAQLLVLGLWSLHLLFP